MRETVDDKTGDLLPACDLAGERPARRSRLDKMRERRGLRGLTVNLPADLVDQFHAKREQQGGAAKGKSANAIIEKLIRTQYLRDR
jgi:hypothetical protein